MFLDKALQKKECNSQDVICQEQKQNWLLVSLGFDTQIIDIPKLVTEKLGKNPAKQAI